MARNGKVIKKWIDDCGEDQEFSIDDRGLFLMVVNHEDYYLEVGGIPEWDWDGEEE